MKLYRYFALAHKSATFTCSTARSFVSDKMEECAPAISEEPSENAHSRNLAVDDNIPRLTKSERKKIKKEENKEQRRINRRQSRNLVIQEKIARKEKEILPKIFIHCGKRCVTPYFYTFTVNVKNRWVGRPLVEILAGEFRGNPYDYYERAIQQGRITVNGQVVPLNYKMMRLQEIVEHRVHRHEPPILDQVPVVLTNQTEGGYDDIIAINKPPSVPVHPCGGYNYNSLTYLMTSTEFQLPHLFPAHRLDRLTSGVLIFCFNPTRAKIVQDEIKNHTASKTYLALVHGILSRNIGEEFEVDRPVWSDPSGENRGCCDDQKGKHAYTHFTVVNYSDEDQVTLVECRPKTGRTHQIRIHLLELGHPIVNDPLYQLCDEEAMKLNQFNFMKANQQINEDYLNDPTQSFNSPEYQPEKDTEFCFRCTEPIADVPLSQLYLCLHSLKYTGEGWSFTATPPFWATKYLPTDK